MSLKVKLDGVVNSMHLMVLAFGLMNMVCQFIYVKAWWFLVKTAAFPETPHQETGKGKCAAVQPILYCIF